MALKEEIEMDECLIYHISTNPITTSIENLIADEGDMEFAIQGLDVVTTGMLPTTQETIEAIKKSSLVYLSGNIDSTTFFELGIALSLDKKIYSVTSSPKKKLTRALHYDLDSIEVISLRELYYLLEELVNDERGH